MSVEIALAERKLLKRSKAIKAKGKEIFESVVLVVDDDPIVQILIRKYLEEDGFVVFTAGNGAIALDIFKKEQIDIVLLDVEMPVMGGFDTCLALRQLPEGDTLPILMITGRNDQISIDRAFDAGATDFAAKPINWVILSRRISYMLRASRAFDEMHKNHAQLVEAQQLAKIGYWEFEIAQERFFCSEAGAKIFGFEAGELSLSFEHFIERAQLGERLHVEKSIRSYLASGVFEVVEFSILLSDGTYRFVHMQGKEVEKVKGRKRQDSTVMGVVQDITERRKAEEKIRHLAYFDSLTGLMNREAFKEHLNRAIKQAKENKQRMAVMFMDLDDFKRINDTLGHSAGDRLLSLVADRLSDNVRVNDYLGVSRRMGEAKVARLGGDEFTFALPEIDQIGDVARVARRILNDIARPMFLAKQEVFVTPSIGISIYPDDGEDVDSLLMNADAAMYHTKDKGKNGFQFYNQSMNVSAMKRFQMENRLRKAIELEEFEVYYQPQFNTKSNMLVGMEALLRWNNEELGFIPPDEFIPLAEESGFIIEIGKWVLYKACEQSKYWQSLGFPSLRLGVNLSPRQFQDEELDDILSEVLNRTKLPPHCLELELTENIIMNNVEENINMLSSLREMGLGLSIDDFGTGYSSLSYLKRLPIQTLKIDRSFILNIPNDLESMAIVQAIIAMAHNLNLKVIAEGVETEEQLNFLRKNLCDEVQGFFLGRPMPVDAFSRFLEGQIR